MSNNCLQCSNEIFYVHWLLLFRVLFSNGAWRAEQGEYEDHDGVIVFVIRGVFSYFTREVINL